MNANWWSIARLELTLAMRDRGSVMWSLVAPVAMAWVFGAMFGSGGPPQPTRVHIDVGANPPGLGEFAEKHFESRGFVVADDGIAVMLPDSMMTHIETGRPVDIRVMQGDASSTRARLISATAREIAYAAVFDLKRDGERIVPRYENDDSFLSLQTETRGTAPRTVTGKEHMLPAMLIMYIMFQVMTFFLSLWVDDLRTGKIKRIVMSPATTGDLLLGEIAARLIWAALQVVIIIGIGSLVLGVHLDVNWLNFGLVVFAFMLAAASLGMLAASFFKTSEKAGAIGVMLSLVLAALGGCWWPLEIVPGFMRKVAMILPTGQAMSAIGEMLAVGPTAPFPGVSIGVLVLMAVVAMVVAARRMRLQLIE